MKTLNDEKLLPVNAIFVHGGLNIGNVKITSYGILSHNYAQSNGSRNAGSNTVTCGSECNSDLKSKLAHVGNPRPYLIEKMLQELQTLPIPILDI